MQEALERASVKTTTNIVDWTEVIPGLRKVDKESGPRFIEGPNDQANLRRLLKGEVDYVLVDDLLIRHLRDYQEEEAARHLQIGTTPLVRRTLHFAVREDLHESSSIIASFNDAIKTMLADGTYNDILQLSWIRADVDGDGRLELVPRDGDQIGKVAPVSGYRATPRPTAIRARPAVCSASSSRAI